MTKDDIITLPNSHLRQRSQKISFVTPEVEQLIQDMQDATIDWENSRDHEVGVALAAVQVDQLKRIVVVRNDFNDKDNHDFTIFINPVITKYEGKVEKDYEGCLSVQMSTAWCHAIPRCASKPWASTAKNSVSLPKAS